MLSAEPVRRKTAAVVCALELLGHLALPADAQRKTETSFAKPTHTLCLGTCHLPGGKSHPPPHLLGTSGPYSNSTVFPGSPATPPPPPPLPAAAWGAAFSHLGWLCSREQKELRRQQFFRQEMVAFYARQASSEIQNKTHHCEKEYGIKGAFITLGSASFEMLTFPL